jgi:hypothetical protein
LALALALAVGAGAPAAAQERQARTAAVLDFVERGRGASLVAREAAAAVAFELQERGYDVRSRAEVRSAVARLGVQPPLAEGEWRRLARELDVNELFAGGVQVWRESAGRGVRTRALLTVAVYSGAGGDLVSGATVAADEVRQEAWPDSQAARAIALTRAAGRALERIAAHQPVTGAVLQYSPRRHEVLLNRGARYGVERGTLFDVLRVELDPSDPNRTVQRRVGRLRVVDVSADDATAEVLEAPTGIRTYDTIREVFRLPLSAAAS